MKKYIIMSIISIFTIISMLMAFTSGSFDVVKSEALNSFNDLLISGIAKNKEGNVWSLTMADGTTKLSLGKSSVMMMLDAQPFIDAGLKTDKLPNYIVYDQENNELHIKKSYDNASSNLETINSIYKNIVDNNRDKLGYHHSLDHFGLSLDNGYAFEYAKNINKNDKDVVFVLNPDDLIDAGVDVNKLEGYVYADVKMSGGQVVKKVLKVFNIEEVSQCLIKDSVC